MVVIIIIRSRHHKLKLSKKKEKNWGWSCGNNIIVKDNSLITCINLISLVSVTVLDYH